MRPTKVPKKRRLKAVVVAIILASVFLIVANIVASNTVAASGKRLSELEAKAQTLEATNQKLERDISQKRSLQNLEAYAKATGLKAINETLNLTSPEALAQAELDSDQAELDSAQAPQD